MQKHIAWITPEEYELEKKILSEYSRDQVHKHLEYLVTLTRISGTDDELEAARYIKKRLSQYDIDVDIHEFDAYVSHPGEAKLEMLSPVKESFPCLSLAFIAPTPPEGIMAELISVGKGFEEDYQGLDVRGKIVLIGPVRKTDHTQVARIAEKMGAASQVHINSGVRNAIDVAQLRTAWGAPTPETISKIPMTPAISIGNEDGAHLLELTRKGRVNVKLTADSWRGYTNIRLPVGTLKGMIEPEKYFLLASHYCGWYAGATDNAVANSLLLEMARIFSKYRKHLGRSVRFAWWPGHSQGTFAGSTWYLDTFWDDIRDNAIAYLTMDGLGRMGSSGFESRNTEEIRSFYEKVIKDILGLEVKSKKLPRSGDQSYWGMGVPSFVGKTAFTEEQAVAMGGKPVWYSHTVDDTLDKVDLEEPVTSPFKVNIVSILRLCNNPVLPFEFVTVAKAFEKRLIELQAFSAPIVDLTSIMNQVEKLKQNAEALNKAIEKNLSDYEHKTGNRGYEINFPKINTCLMALSRILIPALHTEAGKYGQDPLGSNFKPIPTFQPLEKPKRMNASSDEYKAFRTLILRERNKLSDALSSANRMMAGTSNL